MGRGLGRVRPGDRTAIARLLCSAWIAVGVAACSQSSPGAGPGAVVISEIMYHPVLEGTPQDEHEFIELHNPGPEPVALGGWQLAGGIAFSFPADARLEARGFVVVAKNRARLLEVEAYGLSNGDLAGRVLGDYGRELDNDGERVALLDAAGNEVDAVAYDDGFPWPIGADGLGAGERWLGPELLPLERHRYMGRSLERVSATAPSAELANWAPSPLDGATPGRRNAAADAAVPVVTTIDVRPAAGGGDRIYDREGIRLRVGISSLGPPGQLVVESFADDVEAEDEPRRQVELSDEQGVWRASLPSEGANTIVRYRILRVAAGGELEPISPRPSDPYGWHATFVHPREEGRTPIYRLFVKTADWERLWDNIVGGRVPGNLDGGDPAFCALNERWNDRIPATLVHDGKVYDIQARYQGSRTNRFNGPRLMDLEKWPADVRRPARPNPWMPLSWHFNFPRYARFEGKSSFNLSKLPNQSCQGFFATVANQLFEKAGVPAAQTSYARLFINGAYYHFMQRQEHIDEDMLRRSFGPEHEVGDLFKSVGARWDEGPYGFGDERLLGPHCGYSAEERYDWTYKRQTRDDIVSGSQAVREMLEAFHAARAEGTPAVRAFFEQWFDVDRLTNYMVVRNWLSPWDDVWQNHYLYRLASGRWMVMPTDMDNHFGFAGPSSYDGSFFSGVENGRSNYRDLPNYLKDGYLRAFRKAFIVRLQESVETFLHPDAVWPIIDRAAADYALDEAMAAPAGITESSGCGRGDPLQVAARMRDFVGRRYERVKAGLLD